jgi:hypothetical protein
MMKMKVFAHGLCDGDMTQAMLENAHEMVFQSMTRMKPMEFQQIELTSTNSQIVKLMKLKMMNWVCQQDQDFFQIRIRICVFSFPSTDNILNAIVREHVFES